MSEARGVEEHVADVCVVGLGHVGAPLWASMLSRGAGVVCGVEIDAGRRAWLLSLAGGEVEALGEPELGELLRGAHRRGLVVLGETPVRARAVILAMSLGSGAELVEQVVRHVPYVEEGGVLVIASTCGVGWFTELRERLARLPLAIHIAHAPERMMPGRALPEVLELPRVIGGLTQACARAARALYEDSLGSVLVREVGLEEAALVKLAENAYRAVNVVLADELADVAARHGLDAWRVLELANEHPRVSFLAPGLGVGGACLPFAMQELGDETRGGLIARASELNDARAAHVADAIAREVLASCGAGARIALLGVSYKAGQADVRGSASVRMWRRWREAWSDTLEVRACDPMVGREEADGEALFSLDDACDGAAAIVLAVSHEAFTAPSLYKKLQKNPSTRHIFDLCGGWRARAAAMQELGVRYTERVLPEG